MALIEGQSRVKDMLEYRHDSFWTVRRCCPSVPSCV